MARFIYLVKIDGGKSNPDFYQFLENVGELKAIAPDFGGIQNSCLIGHHLDKKTILNLCTFKIKKENKVQVEEITVETIKDDNTFHRMYMDKIMNYFLPFGNGEYVNLQFDEDEL